MNMLCNYNSFPFLSAVLEHDALHTYDGMSDVCIEFLASQQFARLSCMHGV